MSDLVELLAGHPFLSGLDETLLRLLAGCATEATFDAGAYMMREGEEAKSFFLVRSGGVSLEVHFPARAPLRVESVGPGSLLGLSWLFPPFRVHLDARALEPTSLFVLDANGVRAAMEANRDFGYELSRRLLRLMFERLERVRLQRLDVYRSAS